jgi:hypothetical protein
MCISSLAIRLGSKTQPLRSIVYPPKKWFVALKLSDRGESLAMVGHPIPICGIGRIGCDAQSPAWNFGFDRYTP